MLGRVLTCVTPSACARRCVRLRSALRCCRSVATVAITTHIKLRALSLFAASIVWQGCTGTVVRALHNLSALLAIRRRTLLLRWYLTLRCCWRTGGAVLLLRFATAGAACATRRLLRLLSLLLPCLLLCLLRHLLLLSASSPARHLLLMFM